MSPSPRPFSLTPGTVVGGRYEVVREVGRGGVSIVFLARDVKLGTEVALKVSEVPGPLYEDFKGRFQREARLGARLGKEQGFVRALDWGELDPERSIYLAMDYVPNASPLDLRTGALDVRLRKLLMAARLLARVHRLGIVHRDVKPDNFLADTAGRLYLTDFGLAKELDQPEAPPAEDRPSYRTGTGLTLGTPLFMSPEQFGETRDVGTRTDVYALGVMLYHCLSGAFPYSGTNAMQVMSRQMEVRYKGAPPPSLAKVPGTDPVLVKLCADMIHLEPGNRPGADEVARRLEAFLGPPTGVVKRPIGASGPVARPPAQPTAVLSPPTRAGSGRIPTPPIGPGVSSRSQLRIDQHGLSSREVLWKIRRDVGREAFRQIIGTLAGLRIADERPLNGVDASGFLDRLAFLLPRQFDRSHGGLGVVLGRAPENDVILPFSTISKRQLRFDPLPNGDWTVQELGSRNGTRLNGVQLGGPPRVLSENDSLCLSEHLVLEFLTPGRIVEWVEERANDSSVHPERGDGLGGKFKGDDLVEFLQMVDFHKKTGALRVHDNVRFRGTAYFTEGRLRGAHTSDGGRGEAALRTLLSIPGGRFRFSPTLPEDLVPDLDLPLAPVLFEAMRQRDEQMKKTTQVVEIRSELLADIAPDRDDLRKP